MTRFIFYILLFTIPLFCNDITLKIDPNLKKYLTQEEIKYISDKKIITATNEFDYAPMDFNINGLPIGYSIDLLNILAQTAGLKVKYITKAWTDLLDDFNNKKIDLIHTIYKGPEREKTMLFSTPYLVGTNSYIIKKNSNDINSIKDLYGKRVGVSKGWYEEIILSKYPKIKKVYLLNLKEKLDALSIGKIDAFINDINTAAYYIKKYGFTDIKISNPVIERNKGKLDKYHFATLKEQSILISILDKAYANIDIGELSKLQNKWFGDIKKEKQIFNADELNYLVSKKKIKMCVFPNIVPLSDLENNKFQGAVSDIFTQLEKNTKLEFETVPTNSIQESFKLLKEKKCDILPTVEYSNIRRTYFNLTKPYLEMFYVAIGKDNREFFVDISELKDKKISTISESSVIKDLENKIPSIKVIKVDNIEDGLDLVKSEQVYVHLTPYPIAKYYLAKANSTDLKIIGRLVKPLKLSIGSRNDDAMLASIMQKAIDTISQTKINAIMHTWTDVKIKKVIDYSFFYRLLFISTVLILLGIWRYNVLKNKNKEISSINQRLKESQEEIIKQKEEFEAIFRYSKDGIAILDFESKIIDFNSAFIRMLDFTREELFSKKFIDIVLPEEKEEIIKIIENAFKKGYVNNFEKICLGKEGKKVLANMTIMLMPDNTRLLLTAKDITSTKLLESQSKLASIGEMIGNIAHQWRQPLSIITTSASGLSLKADFQESVSPEEIKEFSQEIVEQAQYLSKTIDDFRNFIKADTSFVQISLKEALFNAISLTKASLKSNYITLIEDVIDDINIEGNKNELGQVFINIINNAKDKLKEIDERKQDRYIFVSTKKINDSTLEIKILDNGGGIKEEAIKRVFEPYFTTKDQTTGTGLGLSMSDKIIRERHKGTIEVRNEEFQYKGKRYKGACFIIKLYSEAQS